MKVLVTGGAGFIGSNLVDNLVFQGHEVVVFDNMSTGNKNNLLSVRDKIDFHMIDIANDYLPDDSRFRNIDYIFHLAALPRIQFSIDHPEESHLANVMGTLKMLEYAKKLNVKRLIYASSSSVYGNQPVLPLVESMKPNPLNPYALHKLMGEQYAKMYRDMFGVQSVGLRFFNVYGRRMSMNGAYKLVFAIWIEQIKRGMALQINGDGNQTRDFTHVSDVVNALIAAMDMKETGIPLVLNVGSGKETSVNRLAELFGYPVKHVETRKFEEARKVASLDLAKIFLKWEPGMNIELGVEILKREYGI